MHTPEDDRKAFVIRIPWDSNTVRGFITALVLIVCFVLITPFIKLPPQVLKVHNDSTSIPIEVIRIHFGDGKGPGKSHGNLQTEGASAKATQTAPRFQDASAPKQSASNKQAKPASNTEISSSIKLTKNDPKTNSNTAKSNADENTTTKKSTQTDNSTASTQGDKNGTNGPGRGIVGNGTGAGNGFNIEWGGGGGALVLNKRLPSAPKGLNNSTIVKLKFIVDKFGDVISVVPLTRGAPQAETAAQTAMWLWKFKVNTDQPVTGVIKFYFDVN